MDFDIFFGFFLKCSPKKFFEKILGKKFFEKIL